MTTASVYASLCPGARNCGAGDHRRLQQERSRPTGSEAEKYAHRGARNSQAQRKGAPLGETSPVGVYLRGHAAGTRTRANWRGGNEDPQAWKRNKEKADGQRNGRRGSPTLAGRNIEDRGTADAVGTVAAVASVVTASFERRLTPFHRHRGNREDINDSDPRVFR